MRAAFPSPPRPSSPKRIAMPAWKSGTWFTRNTDLLGTRATPRPITSKLSASTVRLHCIAILSRRSSTLPAGPRGPRKLRYPFSSASHKISAGQPEVSSMKLRLVARRAVFLVSIASATFCLWTISTQFSAISSDVEAQTVLAPTPPMGWNSWDSYGETVTEPDIRANAAWMAEHLKSYGWQYIVVDEGWYVTNQAARPAGAAAEFSLDAYGRYIPGVNTIPSSENGAGFKPLADYVHSLGLKFGIHILRGIPKEAVFRNTPIAGTSFRA